MTEKFSKDMLLKVIEGMHLAVADKGKDHVYVATPRVISEDPYSFVSCVYFDNQWCPSCLVGHGLSYAGVGPKEVVEGTSASRTVGYSSNLWGHPNSVEEILAEGLNAAQSGQDKGDSWGEAMQALAETVKDLCDEYGFDNPLTGVDV